MSKVASQVKDVLNQEIDKLFMSKNKDVFIRDPIRDFSRSKKFSFADNMKFIITMGPSSIREELLHLYDYDLQTISASAFVQSRQKIKPDAFERLLHKMNERYPCKSTYKGLHLIAVDGCDIAIPMDPDDKQTLIRANDTTYISMFHLHSAYDLLEHRYVDSIIEGRAKYDEPKALYDMSVRYKGRQSCVFIADRNYISLNRIEHMKTDGTLFLIRSLDISSRNCFLKRCPFSGDVFDQEAAMIFTRKQTNEVKKHPEKYKLITRKQRFDFLDENTLYYETRYRVIRLKIDGKEEYETLITNLPKDRFTSKDIERLYNLRWGIETSFRHLKYAADMTAFHSRIRDSLKQEIFARLILYNLNMIVIGLIIIERSDKYEYAVNITRAFHILRIFFSKGKSGCPPDPMKLIKKEILPIRPGRNCPRKVRPQSLVSFNYRFS